MVDLRAAAIAADRFGFGARPGELATIAPDPRGWLRGQLHPDPAAVAGTPSGKGLVPLFQAFRERKGDIEFAKSVGKTVRQEFFTAAFQRTLTAANSTTPFRERLVQFWSNHFTVSSQRRISAL